MTTYVIRRLLMLIPVLLAVSLLTFAIAKVTPGDPVVLMLGDYATPEQVTRLRLQLGLDDPVPVQYGRYLWNLLHGDLGISIRGQLPILPEITARIPSTIQLAVVATLIAVIIGVGAGIFAATHFGSLLDRLTMAVALFGLSLPSFWLAIVAIIVFGVNLRWVTVAGGAQGPAELFLASFCLAVAPAAVLARMTRSTILEVIHEDYVRTARAKGLGEWMTTLRHVLRNALIPVVTVIGLQFSGMLGGTVFIESVFARPGLGTYATSSIFNRDYPRVQAMVLLTATIFVLANVVVDVLYAWIDPRIRTSYTEPRSR